MKRWLPILMLCATAAQAETYCSTNAQELRANLALAQATDEGDEVRVAAGSYAFDAPVAFERPGASTGFLILTGGWDPVCAEKTRGAQWTKIEATVPDIGFSIIASEDVLLFDLHFIGFETVSLRNRFDVAEPADVRVSRVGVFTDHDVGDALSLSTPSDRVTLDDVLVDAHAACGVLVASALANGRVEIASSTLISRRVKGAAVCFDGTPGAAVNAATNSVMAAPDGFGVFSGGLPGLLRFSAYDEALGCPQCNPPVAALHPDSVSNLVQAMPFDRAATGDLARFTRVAKATAMLAAVRDSGDADQPYVFDVMGNPRNVGGIDRGAFELSFEALFGDGFE